MGRTSDKPEDRRRLGARRKGGVSAPVNAAGRKAPPAVQKAAQPQEHPWYPPQAMRKAAAAAPQSGRAESPREAPKRQEEVGGPTNPSAAPQRGLATAPRAAPEGRE